MTDKRSIVSYYSCGSPKAPSLHRRYPASSVLRASPSPHTARPVPRGLSVDPYRDHRWGFPCCVWSPMRTCHRHYPGRFDGACSLVPLHRQRPSLCNSQVGSSIAFSGPAQRSLTLWPARSRSRHATLSTEGSDSFVASAAASIATGWSEPVPGRDRAEARALGHEKTQSRFLGPPCNPGRSDFPIPVLALAIPERSFQDRGSSSARSHTPHPCRFTSRLVLSIMAPPTYVVGHTGTAKCPELLCLSQV